MDQTDPASRLAVLEARAEKTDQSLCAIQRSTAEISRSLQQLIRLEEQHAETRRGLNRAFGEIQRCHAETDARLRVIEDQMPVLTLVRRWVLISVTSLAGIAGLSAVLITAVVKHDLGL